jgi:hypothetical protein
MTALFGDPEQKVTPTVLQNVTAAKDDHKTPTKVEEPSVPEVKSKENNESPGNVFEKTGK